MHKRIIISCIFIPAIIYIIYADFFNSFLLFCFTLLISILTSKEFHSLIRLIFRLYEDKKKLISWFSLPGMALIIFYYVNLYLNLNPVFLIVLGGIIFIFLLSSSSIYKYQVTGKTMSSFLILSGSYFYTSVFPLIILIIRQHSQGVFLLYILFLLAWFNDASAYFIGYFFGKTRGIIRYSPNKSLEGYAGAFILTVALGYALQVIFLKTFPFSEIQAIIIGVVIAVCAPLGDLLESLIKRKAGVKDSSNLFPGLGGVLDIFDSVLMSAPFYYILLVVGRI